MESRPGWWELAFDSAGDLVGLVMPACAPSMTTIGNVGVVPEHRGSEPSMHLRTGQTSESKSILIEGSSVWVAPAGNSA